MQAESGLGRESLADRRLAVRLVAYKHMHLFGMEISLAAYTISFHLTFSDNERSSTILHLQKFRQKYLITCI